MAGGFKQLGQRLLKAAKKSPIVTAIGLAVVGVTVGSSDYVKQFTLPSAEQLAVREVGKLIKKHEHDKPSPYVSRLEVEDKLKAYLNDPEDFTYLSVFGPRGCGKSTLVTHVLSNVPHIKIKPDGMWDVIPRVKSALGLSGERFKDILDADDLEPIFSAIRKEYGNFAIYMELPKEVPPDNVYRNAQDLRHLITDLELVKGIIVFSDACSTLDLPPDTDRQSFAGVGEFTPDEALQYLKKRFDNNNNNNKGSSSGGAKYVLDLISEHISLYPATLKQVTMQLRKNLSIPPNLDDKDVVHKINNIVNNFVALEKNRARKDVEALFRGAKLDKGIQRALEQAAREMVAKVKTSFEIPRSAASPESACAILKMAHAFQYHIDSDSYSHYSLQHRRAVEAWIKDHPQAN